MSSFAINPVAPMASEIAGLDCSLPFSDEVLRLVKKEFLDHPVLIFPDQVLSASQLAAFGRQFGALESYGNAPAAQGAMKTQTSVVPQKDRRDTPDQMLYPSPDDPDVFIMTNEINPDLPLIGIVDNAEMWHSDASHKSEPCKAIAVHVTRNPANGGDTEFCDMRAVYAALTPDLKTALNGRTSLHHWSKSKNPRFEGTLDAAAWAESERIAHLVPATSQPLVRTHPETGQPSLYLSPRFTLRIEGIPEEYSAPLLKAVCDFADNEVFRYRHKWQENDLVIWDNRCLNHRVRAYATGDIRRRHRVTIAGEKPFYRQAHSVAAT